MIGLLYVLAARNRAEAAGELVAVFSADKGCGDQDSVVTLFDAGGHFLQLPAKHWARALRTAMAHGWRPTGAAPPPRHWGLNVRPRLRSTGKGATKNRLDSASPRPMPSSSRRLSAGRWNARATRSSPSWPDSRTREVFWCARSRRSFRVRSRQCRRRRRIWNGRRSWAGLGELAAAVGGFRAATQGNDSVRYYAAELRQ
jgi:hypothetical protein